MRCIDLDAVHRMFQALVGRPAGDRRPAGVDLSSYTRYVETVTDVCKIGVFEIPTWDTDARLSTALNAGDLAAAQAAVADGASVRAPNDDGEEPLHVACFMGHLEIAQWLHSEGASLDSSNANASLDWNMMGWTPLHNACCQGHLEIAQWLCSAGADATLKANNGSTPAQILQALFLQGGLIQRPGGRTVQLDQQALRSTLACLVRRVQAQGPPPCPAASVQALTH